MALQQLRVVLATGNSGKAREFARLLGPCMSVEPLPEGICLPPETESTFVGNARLKAEAVASVLGHSVAALADDSGLEVAALGGQPGVLSARYAGEGAGDSDNVGKLLGELGENPERSARFVCSLCLVLPTDLVERVGVGLVEVQGVLDGEITRQVRGTHGFGYDPVFRPAGWQETLAEADPSDKDSVSHRGAATRELLRRLAALGLVDGIEV